jgi:tRNA(fMet)-specific endonuclease VapC
VKYLLDSSIIVAAIKGRLPVVVKLSALKPDDVAVSVIGRMEAEMGLRGNARLQGKYAKLLRDFFANVRVLDFGAAEAQQAMTLGSYLQQSDERLDTYGLLIAGTALAHQLTLVTEDTTAYMPVPGLETENWLRQAV